MKLKYAAIAVVLTLMALNSSAQVVEQTYPEFPANEVTDMLRWNGDTLFATACNWSLLRSTDAGANWEEMLDGWPRYNLVRMGSDGKYLYLLPIATGFTRVAMREEPDVRLLRYDPRSGGMDTLHVERVSGDPRFLYVDLAVGRSAITLLQIGDTTRLLLSTDAGENWKDCRLPAGYDPVYNGWNTQLAVRDELYMLFFVNMPADVAVGRHVFLSNDAGQSWEEVPGVMQDYLRSARTPRFPAGWFGDSLTVILNGRTTPVISSNLGSEWFERTPIEGMITALSFETGGVGYVVDHMNQVWKSLDFGGTWSKVREGFVPPASGEISSCAVQIGQDTLVTIDLYGQIMRTTDGGLSWDAIRWSEFGEFYDLQFVTPEIGYVQATDRTQGALHYLRTTDGGSTWNDHGDFPRSGQSAKFFYSDLQTGFAVRKHLGTQSEDTLIFRSVDGGNHWEPVFPWSATESIDINTLPRGRWFRGADTGLVPLDGNRLLRTTDGGDSWTVQSGLADIIGTETEMRIQWLDIRSARSMWIAAERKILRSDDAGVSWLSVLDLPDSLPDSRRFARVTILADETIAAVSGNTTDPHIVYLSTNNGTTWESWPAQSGADGELFPGLKGVGVTGSSSHGYSSNRELYRTEDGWRTHSLQWSQSHIVVNSFRQMFFLDEMHGWIFGANAIFRTTNGGVNWTKATPVLPSSPRIVSTWPQPATGGSAMTTIIDITQPGRAHLELYDLLGRRRAVLFDGHSDATRRTISWSAGGVEAGVYVLRLVVQDAVVWKTFVKR
ncbi:MAG: T9SS type A sorting domain-containing protein [Bacteroidetes bacterium]|nr:T9SS type A sorting domain-containing protein [Bacteroidota bacterium]